LNKISTMEAILNIDHFERIIFSVIVIVIGLIVLYFTIKSLRQYIVLLKPREARIKLVRKVVMPVVLFIVVLAIRLNLPNLVSEEELMKSLKHFFAIILILSSTWILINAIRITRIIILSKYDVSQKNNLLARKLHTQFRIVERILIFILVFIAIALILLTFDSIKQIGISLFASAGVAGLIIGLAAQKVIGSILAGFQLAITQPIRIDDVVIVENEWGWIEEITLTYVVIRLWDKRRLVVPTTYFIEKPFQNWTRTSSELIGSVFIFTDYTMPVRELREQFEKILSETDLWDGNIANVQVTNSTNHSIEIRFLMSAHDSPTLWDLRTFVREKVVEYLQENHPDKLPRARILLNQTDNPNFDEGTFKA
jgi:small-conductance mechanosensitive channel